MKRILIFLATVGIVLVSTTVRAEECKEAIPLTTPCEGLLVPAPEVMAALLCLDVDLPREKALHLKTKGLCEEDLKFWKEKYEAEKEYSEKLEIKLNTALTTASDSLETSWYEHPIFWFAGGAITAIGVAYAIKPVW